MAAEVQAIWRDSRLEACLAAPYLLLKSKRTSTYRDQYDDKDAPRVRSRAEISAAALDAYWEKLNGTGAQDSTRLGTSPFVENCRWYIRDHWKQAVVTTLCYLLTFLLWRRLL